MTTSARHACWYASSESDIRKFLDTLPFEHEEIKRDFAYYVARLRYVAEMAGLKAEEIINESREERIRIHALLLRILLDNLALVEDREIVKVEWPRNQGGGAP